MARDWESTLRSWIKPASDSEEEKRERTERAITDALNAVPGIRDLPIKVYAKGSYANNTNVRADSDVDVAVEYTGIEYFDFTHGLEGMTREEAHQETGAFGPVTTPYSAEQLKNDVERALVEKFGRAAVTRHNKALTVREQSNRLAADVVPCFTYRRYWDRAPRGGLRCHKGTRIFPDTGWPIENWPQQHLDNGNAKNSATGRRYKRMVRALKNLENELCGKGLINEAPGYFAECLVYNVPNDHFGHTRYVDDMRAVLAYVFNQTMTDEKCSEFVEINELKWLFRGSQKWTRKDAHKLVGVGWDYMEFE